MMPPRSRRPDLAHDLLGRLEVGLDDGVLEPSRGLLADVAAGVDVDRHQRFGLVDDDRSAGLQPHLAAQRLVELRLHAVLLEDREVLVVERHARREVRHDAADELERALVFLRVVDADRGVIVGQQVAQQLGDEARLLVDRDRRALLLAALPHVDPDLVEVIQVRQDVVLRPARGRGADDHAAAEVVLLAELADNAAQARALLAAVDLPRDADVIHGRHEHQEASRQRDMTRQARALGAERLLGDLDDDVLAFLEQLFDLRLGSALLAFVAVAATAAATPLRRGAGRRRTLRVLAWRHSCWQPACPRPRHCHIHRGWR